MQKTVTLNWTPDRRYRLTPAHFLIAALASLPLLALMSRTPASWWVQSGFETYPGTYVRMTNDNYGLCRPWREPVPGTHKEPGVHVTTRFGDITGGIESNFSVLLPATAHVTAIYCGTGRGAGPLSECSVLKCPVPAHAQLEDSLFTRGRGIEFSFRAKTTDPGQKTRVGYWILWKQG
jgi:hypothetical protein